MAVGRQLYLRVGALVLVGLALAVGMVIFLTANRYTGQRTATFETYFRESVQGLDVGSSVRFRGVPLGRVTEVSLVSSNYRSPADMTFAAAFQLVLVRFVVDMDRVGEEERSLDEAVRAGLRVRLASQGITGVLYLEIDFVSPTRYPAMEVPWTPKAGYIPAIPSTVAQVQSAAENLLQKLQEVDVAGLVGNLAALVADLRRQSSDGDLAHALQESALLVSELRGTLQQLKLPETMAEVRGAAQDARGVMQSREVRTALQNSAQATAELRTALARLGPAMESLNATLRAAGRTTTDTQAELDPILRDMRAAVANLRDTTEMLRRNPSQAIFGAPPEPRR